ncbi:MAG: alpha/beta fold hydrolase [Chitinophagaceae bacterium]
MKQIILLHGAIGAADQLAPLSLELEQKGYKVHNLNFSGHGKEPFAAQFGIQQFAAEVFQYILQHNLQQPDIFGYSMGGYVALWLALEKPALLGNVITLATKFAWTPEAAVKESGMIVPEKLEAKVPHFAAALQQRHGETWKDLLARTREMMLQLGEEPLLAAASVAALGNRVLLGVGDSDTMVSLDETLAIRNGIPGSSLYVLPQTPHPIEKVPVGLLASLIGGFSSDIK